MLALLQSDAAGSGSAGSRGSKGSAGGGGALAGLQHTQLEAEKQVGPGLRKATPAIQAFVRSKDLKMRLRPQQFALSGTVSAFALSDTVSVGRAGVVPHKFHHTA